MVIDVTCGRMLRGRYADDRDVSTGAEVAVPVSTAFHCRYRALGLVICEPSAFAYEELHSLHASSGVRVLPERVKISTLVPAGAVARHATTPHVETRRASFTSDSKLPRVARTDDTDISSPGFAVARNVRSPARAIIVACCAGTRVTSTALTGSPLKRNSLPFVPVATSTAPSDSMATSYGASSLAVHSSSHKPSGCTRYTAPVIVLRRSPADEPPPNCAAPTSTTVIEVISVETFGIDGVTGGGVIGESVIDSPPPWARLLCAAA